MNMHSRIDGKSAAVGHIDSHVAVLVHTSPAAIDTKAKALIEFTNTYTSFIEIHIVHATLSYCGVLFFNTVMVCVRN